MSLKKQARTDGLTGLSNRRHFVEAVENKILRNKRYHKDCAFLMLDIDHFKLFDDEGAQVKLTISIGIAKYNQERDSLEELMICSDKALYRAKDEGRNRVVSME